MFPQSVEGLKNAIEKLGCSCVNHIDFDSPDAQEDLERALEKELEQGHMTSQEKERYEEAIALVRFFPWEGRD